LPPIQFAVFGFRTAVSAASLETAKMEQVGKGIAPWEVLLVNLIVKIRRELPVSQRVSV
jgi:hypothetical protein